MLLEQQKTGSSLPLVNVLAVGVNQVLADVHLTKVLQNEVRSGLHLHNSLVVGQLGAVVHKILALTCLLLLGGLVHPTGGYTLETISVTKHDKKALNSIQF